MGGGPLWDDILTKQSQSGNEPFFSGPWGNLALDSFAVTRKDNYAQQILGISSLASYWRLGDLPGSQYSTVILNDKPLAYWRLDDVGSTAADATGHGFTGTLGGGITQSVAGATADANTAMTFDGATGIITASTFKTIPAQAISFECWVNHNAVAWGAAHEITIFLPTAQAHYLSVNNGNIFMSVTLSGTQNTAVGSAVPTSGWHHLVAVWDGSHQILWIDGVTDSLTSHARVGSLQTNVGNATIGFGAGSPFNGTIDELAIYGYALTSSQIATHYAAGQGKYADIKGGRHGTLSGTVVAGPNALPSDPHPSNNSNSVGKVTVPDDATLTPQTSFSIDGWLYWDRAYQNFDTPFGHTSTSAWNDGYGFRFAVGGSTLVAFWLNTYNVSFAQFTLTPGSTFFDSKWHYLTGTWDGSLIKIYWDGFFKAQAAFAGPITYAATTFQMGGSDTSNRWRTSLSDIAFYSDVLSPAQILSNYQVGVGFNPRLNSF